MQLIRTTFWTRFDDADRFDEKEEQLQKEVTNGQAMNGDHDDNLSTESVVKPKGSILRRFAVWFCGIKSDAGQEEMSEEQQAKLASIEQNRIAKYFLSISLIFVI